MIQTMKVSKHTCIFTLLFADHVSVGATYTRWGKSVCQSNGTELVYSGLTAGSHYTHGGAAVNNLCLTKSPLWNKFDDNEQVGALVYGAKYEFYYRNTILHWK